MRDRQPRPGHRPSRLFLIQWNNLAYSIGEATLGVGGSFLCSLLFRSRLIPRFLAVGGLVGYVSLTVGMVAEIFGIHIGRTEIVTTVRPALATS